MGSDHGGKDVLCHHSKIQDLYASHDAFCFPSFREPAGGVLYEAMRHGLPVITADRGGYDNIIELGGAMTLPLSLRAVRPGGTLSMIGVLSGLNIEASLGPIVARQVRLQGVTVGHRDGYEAMLAAMAQHEIRPVLGVRFGFEELKEALGHLRAGGHFGKTLIQF